MALHRIPRKQLDTDIFYVYDDMDRIVGLDRTTAQVHDHLHDIGDLQNYHRASNIGFDPTTNPLTTNTVQHAVAEFANKPIASPVHEISGASVTAAKYHITSITDAYVGVGGEDPNAVFAVYDVAGRELPITILDITSDEFGTTSVAGNTWHNQPWIQLSAVPNEPILIKYGIQSSMASLPINALLKEGVIVAEVDSEVTAALADIKGTSWDVAVEPGNSMYDLVTIFGLINTNIADITQLQSDVSSLTGDFTATIADMKGVAWDTPVTTGNNMYDLVEIYSNLQLVYSALADIKRDTWTAAVPNTRDLIGLDNRTTVLEGLIHAHGREDIAGAQLDGVSTAFTTSVNFLAGTLNVYLNGTRIPVINVVETGLNAFVLTLEAEQIPDAAVADTLSVEYVLA